MIDCLCLSPTTLLSVRTGRLENLEPEATAEEYRLRGDGLDRMKFLKVNEALGRWKAERRA